MARKQIAPIPNRINIFNSFDKLLNGNWAMKGEQLIVCLCGHVDGFRVFPEGDIKQSVEDHIKVCPLIH